MADNKRIRTDGGDALSHNPFAALNGAGLPPAPEAPPEAAPSTAPNASKRGGKNTHRGRVDIVREKAGRGGKTVTVIRGFVGIGLPEKERLAKDMQRVCGTGGTVKDGNIEIQGDKRPEVAKILTEAGFRPVFAGG